MTACDFTPLFRSGVGFDRIARLAEKAGSASTPSYPPYDIEKLTSSESEAYAITLAVAGFSAADLEIEAAPGVLTVRGHKTRSEAQAEAEAPEEGRQVLYRGIATRDFVRRFQLDDAIVVREARLADGLLTVTLEREVRRSAPRRITIDRHAA